MSIESQLREALSARADELSGPGGLSDDPYARVAGAIAVNRRRRRTAALAGVAAVAAIAVAVPSLAGGLGRDTTTPARRTQVVVPGPQDPRWASVSTWPTRGSLADDRAFLASFRAQVDVQSVLYAGDIGADRVVVTRELGEDQVPMVKVYADDRGARADALLSIASSGEVDGAAVIVRRDPTPTGWMLVLASSAVRSAEVSPTATIRADGTVTRSWDTVALEGGMAVIDLHDAPLALTRVRVGGYDGGVLLPARSGTINPVAEGFCGNCTGQDFLDHAVKGTSYDVATTVGLPAEAVTTTTLVNAVVDPAVLATSTLGDATQARSTGRLYVGLTRLPGGQVLRTAQLGVEEKGGGGMSTALETAVPLDAATAERRPFVLHGQTADGKVTRYQVFAPNAARVRLVGDLPGSEPTAMKQVVGGSAIFSLDEAGASGHHGVETYDASGALTGTWPLDLPNRDAPFDVQP
jgi:hypothetical protein